MVRADNLLSPNSSNGRASDQDPVDSQGARPARHTAEAELTEVAWVAHGELSYAKWVRCGSRLGVASRNAGWWIGDWIRYGATRYGSKYALAARVTGYDDQTLMNMVYVATRFEVSRRREKLSWSHHAELAAFDREDQERWLDRAIAEKLTVRGLRRELSCARPLIRPPVHAGPATSNDRGALVASPPIVEFSRGRNPASASATHGKVKTIVTCPHCSHEFLVLTQRGDLLVSATLGDREGGYPGRRGTSVTAVRL